MDPKKILVPPLVPVALLLMLCAWVFYSEVTGEGRMIDGRPDNAPARASVILALLSPLAYVLFAVLNLLDAALDRLSTRVSWIGTTALTTFLGFLFSWGFYAPEVDSTPYPAIAAGFAFSVAVFMSMAAVRRSVLRDALPSKAPNQAVR